MTLKATVDTITDVPEALREHYIEREGKFHLAAEGMVPKARIDEFRDNNVTLKRERDELLAKYGSIDPEKYRELSEREQKIREKTLIEAGKVDELVAERTAAMKADHDRITAALASEKKAATAQLEDLVLGNGLRDAATKAGVRPAAMEDVLLRGRSVYRMENGKAAPYAGDKPIYGKSGEPMDFSEWMGALTETAPHLFEPSKGGGAKGSGATDGAGKTITRAQFNGMSPTDKMIAARTLKIVD